MFWFSTNKNLCISFSSQKHETKGNGEEAEKQTSCRMMPSRNKKIMEHQQGETIFFPLQK